jgi:hypothetical protein
MYRIQYGFIWISFWLIAFSLPAQVQTNFVTPGVTECIRRAFWQDSTTQSLPNPALFRLIVGPKNPPAIPTVPGLVLLDEANAIRLTSLRPADADTQRQRLTNRIEILKKTGLFAYVEPDYIVHMFLTPTDSAFVDGTLWALRNSGQNIGIPGADIGVTNAWDITTGSTNVIVAVIDTGIRYTLKISRNRCGTTG